MDKKYGYYPGFLKEDGIEKVLNGSEVDLYFIINMLGGYIWRTNHNVAHGRLEITKSMAEDLIEAQYVIEYCVLNTKRFGVEIPEPKEGCHIERTESYNQWFRWWNNYFQYTLNNDEYQEFEQIYEKGGDISKFKPEGNWKN